MQRLNKKIHFCVSVQPDLLRDFSETASSLYAETLCDRDSWIFECNVSENIRYRKSTMYQLAGLCNLWLFVKKPDKSFHVNLLNKILMDFFFPTDILLLFIPHISFIITSCVLHPRNNPITALTDIAKVAKIAITNSNRHI